MSSPLFPLPASRPRAAALRIALSVGLMVASTAGCALGRHEAPPPLSDEARTARITALEISIEADREALAALVTRPRDVDLEPLHEDTTLRTLAERLRRETAELARLRAEAAAEDAEEAEAAPTEGAAP